MVEFFAIYTSFEYKILYVLQNMGILRHLVFKSFPLTLKHRTRHKLAPVWRKYHCNFATELLYSQTCVHEVIEKFLPNPLPNTLTSKCLHFKKCFQTCLRLNLFLVKLERNSLTYSRARNSKRPLQKSVLYLVCIVLCAMKNLCFIATFDYITVWKDFDMLWDICLG